MRGSAVAQKVTALLCGTASHPRCSTSDPIPCLILGVQQRAAQVPGPLHPAWKTRKKLPALVIAIIWVAKHWIEDLSFSVNLPFRYK